MVETSSEETSSISISETIGLMSQTVIIKERKTNYKKYSDEDLRECVLQWVLQKKN